MLAETYKKVTSLGEEFTEGKETTELSLKENLDTAFQTYMGAVDEEKERWYQNIMSQVTTVERLLKEGILTTDEKAVSHDKKTPELSK